jgi:hypothetical protein
VEAHGLGALLEKKRHLGSAVRIFENQSGRRDAQEHRRGLELTLRPQSGCSVRPFAGDTARAGVTDGWPERLGLRGRFVRVVQGGRADFRRS